MADWVIHEKGKQDARWSVRLGGCKRTHAETVLFQLEHHPDVPSNLVLEEANATVKASRLRRIFRG